MMIISLSYCYYYLSRVYIEKNTNKRNKININKHNTLYISEKWKPEFRV